MKIKTKLNEPPLSDMMQIALTELREELKENNQRLIDTYGTENLIKWIENVEQKQIESLPITKGKLNI